MIVGAWKRLIYTPGRPEGTVDRNSYTICVLEQFHRHLKHRSIFAVRSSRWRDPRAHLKMLAPVATVCLMTRRVPGTLALAPVFT